MDQSNPAAFTDLRYAPGIMEEFSHLGLNDETADSIRQILVRQIAEAESSLAFVRSLSSSSEFEEFGE